MNAIKNLSLVNKLILCSIFGVLIYYLVNFTTQILEDRRINSEVTNLKFVVDKVSFENSKYLRNFNDNYIILELKNPVSTDQFNKMGFIIPEENVKAELIDERKIKVNFQSSFIKNKDSSITVTFYNKNIYKFIFKHSDADAEDLKKNPPYDSFEE